MESGARGVSPVTEALEEVTDVPLEGMDRELEIPADPLLPLSYPSTRRLRHDASYFG